VSEKRKRERKARRAKERQQEKEWSQIPEEALRGPCERPECTLPRCLDPWVSKYRIECDRYTGPLVLVCYAIRLQDGATERHLRANGEEVGVIPKGSVARADFAAYEERRKTLTDQLVARYGQPALLCMVTHLAQGARYYQTHHKKVSA